MDINEAIERAKYIIDKGSIEGEVIETLIGEIKHLQENARRLYFPDGSSMLLETPEEVIKFRINSAKAFKSIKEVISSRVRFYSKR